MFYPEKIINIKKNDLVLEIGPGAFPHPRSNIFLERTFEDKNEQLAQSGYATPVELGSKIVYYNGGRFPFKDKEFDYVICSHVVEHVQIEELSEFISEMERVSKRGYIEFPTTFYEFINYQPVHIWLMNFRNNEMIFLDKNIFKSNYIHKIYREMFYGKDLYLNKIFMRYKELFFVGFEWNKVINYKIVKDYDELVNEKDFKNWQEYFRVFNKELEDNNIVLKENQDNLIKKIYAILRKTKRKILQLWKI